MPYVFSAAFSRFDQDGGMACEAAVCTFAASRKREKAGKPVSFPAGMASDTPSRMRGDS
jgi:hypothetical protein